jgi:hypothetical protein
MTLGHGASQANSARGGIRPGTLEGHRKVGRRSWHQIISHRGDWDPYLGAAVSMWASSSLLSVLGIFHPLTILDEAKRERLEIDRPLACDGLLRAGAIVADEDRLGGWWRQQIGPDFRPVRIGIQVLSPVPGDAQQAVAVLV